MQQKTGNVFTDENRAKIHVKGKEWNTTPSLELKLNKLSLEKVVDELDENLIAEKKLRS